MNIADAKLIPLNTIVEHLGGRLSHRGKPHETWYFSPFRPDETKASFKIDEHTNRWHDFGQPSNVGNHGSGGDAIDLWCDVHKCDRRAGVKEALEALKQFAVNAASITNVPTINQSFGGKKNPNRYKILRVHDKIFYGSLKEELARRRISPKTAYPYLKQVFIQDTQAPDKKINGFAFQNDRQGYEISIPNPHNKTSFKTSTMPKAPTTIKGDDPTKVSVFEGFWDFLSWLELNEWTIPPHDVHVLNTVSFSQQIVEKIRDKKGIIQSVFLFMDNDDAGFQATHYFAGVLEPEGFRICDRRPNYQDYKDLNHFWSTFASKSSFKVKRQPS